MEIANPSNYIGENSEWTTFCNQMSKNTRDYYADLWIKNGRANRPLVKQYGWASEALQGKHKGKTSVLLGASPSIKNQIDELKELRKDPDFIFVGISSAIDFYLNNDLHPHYMMIAEASPATERFWQETDWEKTRDITLICCLGTHPYFLERWKGDIKFLAVFNCDKKVDRKYEKWFSPINGCGRYFAGLLSQYNTGAAVAFTIFETSILIFVGNQLSFKDEGDRYYVDRDDIKDKWEREPQIDIHGKKAYTNVMLMSLKLVLEDFLGSISGAGWFFNCTEEGIFGVSSKHGNLPWIKQINLKTGIAQAKQIMRTGEPFYL